MGVFNVAIFLSTPMILLSVLGKSDKPYDPMVAFVCNKGAMHMDPVKGWTSDAGVDCLEDKKNILDYCKQLYPKLDIRNIVETTDHMVIKGWCPLGTKTFPCASPDAFKVQPYRCLSGAFQSDALVVPRTCKFGHTYKEGECSDFAHWHKMAVEACSNQSSMALESYGMLLACGTDMWSGVEHVCCPSDAQSPQPDSSPSSSVSAVNRDSLVDGYLQMQPIAGEFANEHDAFELAKKEQNTNFQQKLDKIRKDWERALADLAKLQVLDSKEATRQDTEIRSRYEKEYLALQEQGDKKEQQLDAVHQQHMQTNFNTKKRINMRKFMMELQNDKYNVDDLEILLHKYISVEQKDGMHCIKHFTKVRARDPLASQDMLPATIEHLTLIGKRIDQSIDLLDTLRSKDDAKKIKANTRSWLKTTGLDIQGAVAELKALPTIEVPSTTQRSFSKVFTTKQRTKPVVPQFTVDFTQLSGKESNEHTKQEVVALSRGTNDEEDLLLEDEEDLILLGRRPEPKEEEKDGGEAMELNRAVEQSAQFRDKMSAGAAIAVAAGVVAAMMVVVFAILIVKKSGRKSTRFSNTYLEVSSDAPELSPEDRHIAAMQNGYENPTYALLEYRKL